MAVRGSLQLVALSEAHRHFHGGDFTRVIADIDSVLACGAAPPVPSRSSSVDSTGVDDGTGHDRVSRHASTTAVAFGLACVLRGFSSLLLRDSQRRGPSRFRAPVCHTKALATTVSSNSNHRTPVRISTPSIDGTSSTQRSDTDLSPEAHEPSPVALMTSSTSDAKAIVIAYPSFVVGRLLAAECALDRGEAESALEAVRAAREFHDANRSLGFIAPGPLQLLIGLITADANVDELDYATDEESICGHWLASAWQHLVTLRFGLECASPTDDDPYCVAQYIEVLEADVSRFAIVTRHAFLVGAPAKPSCPRCCRQHSFIPSQWLCEGCGAAQATPRQALGDAPSNRVVAFFKAATASIQPTKPRAETSSGPSLVWSANHAQCDKCASKLRTGSRHHCRSCGANVCGTCSQQRRRVPALGFAQEVRVCRNCADILDARSCDASPSPQRQRPPPPGTPVVPNNKPPSR